jgi:hypothetical protein
LARVGAALVVPVVADSEGDVVGGVAGVDWVEVVGKAVDPGPTAWLPPVPSPLKSRKAATTRAITTMTVVTTSAVRR